MSGRFPLPVSQGDFRFGFGVAAEVAKVLARFGYPDIFTFYDGAVFDFARLQHVLYGFIHTNLCADKVPADHIDDHRDMLVWSAPDSAPRSSDPVGAPVEFRLIGPAEAATHAAQILADVFTLTYASDALPARDGDDVRIYLTGHRWAPYRGGIK